MEQEEGKGPEAFHEERLEGLLQLMAGSQFPSTPCAPDHNNDACVRLESTTEGAAVATDQLNTDMLLFFYKMRLCSGQRSKFIGFCFSEKGQIL